MSNPTQAAQGSAAAAKPRNTFKQMKPFQKVVHIIKVALFFATFGFAFATILDD